MIEPGNNNGQRKPTESAKNVRTENYAWTNGKDIVLAEATKADIESSKYQTILNSMDDAFAFCELIRDAEGKAINYRYVEFNTSFEKQRHIDRAHFLGRTALDVHPNLEPWWIPTYEKVIDDQQPVHAERFFADRWFEVDIFPHKENYFSVIFKDITLRKNVLEDLQESKKLLARELEDTKLLQQISNQIIEEDNIEDLYHTILRWAMDLMHSDFASIQLLIPETKQLLLLASENFHPDSAKFWKYVGADSTSTCGLALVNGARVIVEDIENLLFNMDKGDYGAYRSSGIVSVQSTPLISRTGNHVGMMSTHWKKPHKPSERELALYDIVARQVADLIERRNADTALRESEHKLREFNNTLEVQVKDRTEELRQSLLHQKKMEAVQQQEIFRTILDTQEAERKRIAESLHNGIGQILYGAKLSLSQALKADLAENDKLSVRDTDKLLNDAITESRRLSHELMPVILEDFGLKVATEDICRQLSGNTQIKCRFKGLTRRFDKYIEVAIYRIIQELMTNVVKHSKATEALVAIEMRRGQILILIQDNGKGIDATAEKHSGIGLKTIRNKVSLLNGNINIESKPGNGTIINIDLPFNI